MAFFHFWPALLFPDADRLLIPLGGPSRWLLQAPPALPQQPSHRGQRHLDAKGLADHHSHPFPSPDVAAKAMGFRPPRQELWQLRPLLGVELRRRAGGHAAVQPLHALQPDPLHPLADRALGDPQRLRDGPLRPALFLQFQGPQAAPFTPIRDLVVLISHG